VGKDDYALLCLLAPSHTQTHHTLSRTVLFFSFFPFFFFFSFNPLSSFFCGLVALLYQPLAASSPQKMEMRLALKRN